MDFLQNVEVDRKNKMNFCKHLLIGDLFQEPQAGLEPSSARIYETTLCFLIVVITGALQQNLAFQHREVPLAMSKQTLMQHGLPHLLMNMT